MVLLAVSEQALSLKEILAWTILESVIVMILTKLERILALSVGALSGLTEAIESIAILVLVSVILSVLVSIISALLESEIWALAVLSGVVIVGVIIEVSAFEDKHI